MQDQQISRTEDAKRNPKQGRFLYRISDIASKELSIKSYVTAPINIWISGGLLVLSCVLYITAFVTTGWGVITEEVGDRVIDVGLWHTCTQNGGACQKIENLTGTYQLCQSLACFSLIALLLSVLVLTLCCVSHHMRRQPAIQLSLFLLRPVSAVLLLLTFALYSGTWNKPNYTEPTYVTTLSYSYSLTVASFSFEFIASLLMLLEWYRWRQLKKKRDPRRLNESGEMVMEINQHTFENPKEETVTQENTQSPFELFKQFSEEEQKEENKAKNANTISQKMKHSSYIDDNRHNQSLSHQYSEEGKKQAHAVDEKNPYEELNHTRQQQTYYNDGFSHEEYQNTRKPAPYSSSSHKSLSLQAQQQDNGRHRQNRDSSSNAFQSGQPMGNLETVSAVVQIHHPPTAQPNVAPKAPARRKAPNVPGSGSLHSYENIPDGQPSTLRNTVGRGHMHDTSYKTGTRRGYTQYNPLPPGQGRNVMLQDSHHGPSSRSAAKYNNITQGTNRPNSQVANVHRDINRARPVKDTVV